MATDNAETDDLEALFDSIAGSMAPAEEHVVAVAQTVPASSISNVQASTGSDVYSQLGQLTSWFHNEIRAIGHDLVGQAAAQIDQSTGKSKIALVGARGLNEAIEHASEQLSSKWQQLMDGKLSVEEFKVLATDTRSFLQDIPSKIKSVDGLLNDATPIVDTQSVKKLGDLALLMEGKALQLLVANTSDDKKKTIGNNVSTPEQIKTALGILGF